MPDRQQVSVSLPNTQQPALYDGGYKPPNTAGSDDDRTPTNELDFDELLIRFKGWFREDAEHCKPWHEEARDDFDFKSGKQWSEEDIQMLRERDRIPVTLNQIDPIIDAVTGFEVANRQEVRYLPRQIEAAPVNENYTEAARWFRDECNAEDEESAAFTDAATCGMGWTETRLDYVTDPEGQPSVKRVSPLDMLWDCAAKENNLTDARRLWRIAREVPIEEARAKFPGFDDADLDANWALNESPKGPREPTDETPPRYQGVSEDEDHGPQKAVTLLEGQWYDLEPVYRGIVRDPHGLIQPKQVELSEDEHQQFLERALARQLIYIFTRQERKIYRKAFIGRVVLDAVELKAPTGQPQSWFSWVPITGKRDENRRYWYGLVKGMKDAQRLANKWLSQSLHIMNTNAKGGLLAEETAFADIRKAEESWAANDEITWLRPGGSNKIKPKPIQGFPPQLMQMTELIFKAIPMLSGVNIEQLGQQSAQQAAALDYQRRQSAQVTVAKLFDSLRHYRKIQGRILLHIITEYVSDGRLIRIEGQDRAQYVPLMKAPGEIKFDVIIDEAPSSPNQKEMVWQTFTQLAPVLLKVGVPQDVYLAVLDYSPLPASVTSKIKAALSQQQQNPQPSPEEIKAKQDQMESQQKMQMDQAEFQHKTQLEQMRFDHEAKMEALRTRAEALANRERTQGQNAIQAFQVRTDAELARIKFRQESVMKLHDAALKEHIADREAKIKERGEKSGGGGGGNGEMGELIRGLHKAMTAPRRVRYGKDGRPEGVEILGGD